jgi:hypothetical protein
MHLRNAPHYQQFGFLTTFERLSVSIDGIYKQLCQPTRAVFGTWKGGLLFGINGHPVLMIDEGSMSKQQSAE